MKRRRMVQNRIVNFDFFCLGISVLLSAFMVGGRGDLLLLLLLLLLLEWIKGHSRDTGNEFADMLAKRGASNRR